MLCVTSSTVTQKNIPGQVNHEGISFTFEGSITKTKVCTPAKRMASKLAHNYLPEFLALGLHSNKPRHVTVNITETCNQRCIYCEIGKGVPSTQQDMLTVSDLIWVIDEMEKSGIRRLSLCGGEPFLFDGLLEVIKYASSKNIRTSVTTNGMTVYKCSNAELAILRESKTDINISVDAFNPEINAITRGTATALPNALKSIKKLQQENIPVTVLTAISRYNFHALHEFIKEAVELGIRQVLFQPIIFASNYPDRKTLEDKHQLNVGPEGLATLMDQLRKIYHFEKRHHLNTNVYRILPWIESYLKTAAGQNGNWFFEEVLEKLYCREIYATIDISYDGNIQPCGLAEASVNIHGERAAGLVAMWHHATAGLKTDIEAGFYPGICNGCCHKFSRNMLASIIRYPLKNRAALMKMVPLLMSRIASRTWKKLNRIS